MDSLVFLFLFVTFEVLFYKVRTTIYNFEKNTLYFIGHMFRVKYGADVNEICFLLD